MATIKQQFTITYEREVNTETGEILNTKIISTSDATSKKTPAKTTDTEAKVYLENNKLQFNTLAVELMGIKPGDRIDIQYSVNYPIIGLSETFGASTGGTKLTKSYTISFRGKKSEALVKHGTEFKVVPTVNNQFILDNGKEIEPQPKGDENVNSNDIEFDLDSFLEDADNTEVSSSMFQL